MFVDEGEARRRLGGGTLGEAGTDFVIDRGILAPYELDGARAVLRTDLEEIERLQADFAEKTDVHLPGLTPDRLPLGPGAALELPPPGVELERSEALVFSPAVANLVTAAGAAGAAADSDPVPYLCETQIRGRSCAAEYFLEEQRARIAGAEALEGAAISRGTKFFGTKRRLTAFLVEALASRAVPDTPILDLMTGSGAAASALSQQWQTWASDSQRFSTILARVQGAGFSERRAAAALPQITAAAQANAALLTENVGAFVEEEDRIFLMRSWEETRVAYSRLIDSFPTLRNELSTSGWNPLLEVDRRRAASDLSPYCLFLSYFANSYFGIRQAIEIDSIRYGIEKIPAEQETERTWAFGALIAAVSDLSTGFGGHFAQPRSHPGELSAKQLNNMLWRRRLSVADEFDMRLRLLGRESEGRTSEISILEGPWQNALSAFEREIGPDRAIVYFDPPYRREEYSRYYHALETLVDYSYPTAVGSGMVPDKARGDRFRSEFFSRSQGKLSDVLAGVVCEVLERGWTCCWSYSNKGAVQPAQVIEELARRRSVTVRSFAAPHQHRGHGRNSGLREVIEYLIVVAPKA
jgi:adenine-specific DNA-methyltransferase